MRENDNIGPKISHENYSGEKITPGNLWGNIFIFMHEDEIFIHDFFLLFVKVFVRVAKCTMII